MSLRFKTNLVVFTIAVISLIISGLVINYIQSKHTKLEAMETARILMEGALAVRHYTINQIRPLLNQIDTDDFLAETVPAFSANKYIAELQKQYPEHSYREAVLNPTNLLDKATTWESTIINRFKTGGEEEIIGVRENSRGKFLHISRPIKITSPKCLACHSTPEVAPKSMLKIYGPVNGFGWKLNEIVGAQIVTVPLAKSLARAEKELLLVIGLVMASFLLIILSFNIVIGRHKKKRL